MKTLYLNLSSEEEVGKVDEIPSRNGDPPKQTENNNKACLSNCVISDLGGFTNSAFLEKIKVADHLGKCLLLFPQTT